MRLPGVERPKPTWLDWATIIVSIVAIAVIIGSISKMGSTLPGNH